MKKFSIVSLISACLLGIFCSCGSTHSMSAGLENVAYLQVVGDTGKYDKLTVVLDDTVSFAVEVNDSQQRTIKNEHTYKIAVGSHDIKIFNGSEVLVNKKIFTSANQVKVVEVQ